MLREHESRARLRLPMAVSVDAVLKVRRHQPTRLEGFVDASFAFAVTLLVISIGHVPTSVSEMLAALRDVPTFAACFLLIVRLWRSHRDWSRHYDLDDAGAVGLSLLLVFLVLIYVYPLRILFSLMFSSLSGGWLAEHAVRIETMFELRAAFVVFGIGVLSIWCVFALLYRHAERQHASIGLSAAERLVTRVSIRRNVVFAAIALLSIALAATLPFAQSPATIWLPGLTYLLLIPAAARLRRGAARELQALTAAAP